MKKKLLLMGQSGAGKTSMRAIIFSNYGAAETRRLGATMEIEHSSIPFIGDLHLNIWDCGGQRRFMNNYITDQKEHLFKDAEVLIYVFDVETRDQAAEFKYYEDCVKLLSQFSPTAKVFCLIHKIDLIKQDSRKTSSVPNVLANYKKTLGPLSQHFTPVFYTTSIWSYTLYQAWSDIAYKLIPNITMIENQLKQFRQLCGASRVVMFEKSTFLVVSHTQEHGKPNPEDDVFVRISETVKTYRQACSKIRAPLVAINIRNGPFSMFLEPFTETTYVLVVMNDPDVEAAVVKLNISSARIHFVNLADIQHT
ncbi:hypothetical protein BB561_006489 [Smittium simulii]|uniref:GTP-binding protein n=1 Tax=Smittium simulii TaxID=133385 RepID=A0A2T9Y3Q8_9FUNG|nr:hypothetical protein BB561_006489 [Smittium simulii]